MFSEVSWGNWAHLTSCFCQKRWSQTHTATDCLMPVLVLICVCLVSSSRQKTEEQLLPQKQCQKDNSKKKAYFLLEMCAESPLQGVKQSQIWHVKENQTHTLTHTTYPFLNCNHRNDCFCFRIPRICFKSKGRTQWLLFCKSQAFWGFYAADLNSFRKIIPVSLCKMSIIHIIGCH